MIARPEPKLSAFRLVAAAVIGGAVLLSSTPPVFAQDTPPDNPSLSQGARLLNDTNSTFGRRASQTFPDDPAQHFLAVQRASELAQSGDCEIALPLLNSAVRDYADHGNIWYWYGFCLEATGNYEASVDALVMALELGVTPWEVEANPNDIVIEIADIYARLGVNELALDWLRRGLAARYDERPQIADREAFSSLAEDPQFAALVGSAPDAIADRDDQWRYDIAFLRDQVALLHSNPDHHTSAAELEDMLAEMSSQVPVLSDEQIAARIDLFVGALGAGHDLLFPTGAERGALIPFALKLYLFTDGLYIIDAYDPALIGARIDAFGDTTAAAAYTIIAKAFPGDNDMDARWMAPRHLTQAYTLEALGIIDDAASASLTITTRDGTQRIVQPERRPFAQPSPALLAPPEVETPLHLSRLNEVYWMQRLDELDALYVQVNGIGDAGDETFVEFASRMAEEAFRPGTQHIILDLRHSPGGNGYRTPSILRQLIRFNADPDKGELFVLIGRNTFSASHNLIVDLDWIADPIFVGEPSGSRPNVLAEAGRFVLPFSRLSGLLSSQLHQQSAPEDHRLWIAPDVPVGLSAQDFFNGEDPAMQVIESLINNRDVD